MRTTSHHAHASKSGNSRKSGEFWEILKNQKFFGNREIDALLVEKSTKEKMSWFRNAIANLAAFDSAICCAAYRGHIWIVKLCREFGATDFEEAMCFAARNGHVEIVKLCREYGATDFEEAMCFAARNGHVEIIKLCREFGATAFDSAIWWAAENGHVAEIVKLCNSWLGYDSIHQELFRHHHKREFSRRIYNELLPLAWHPDRFWDWCVCEEEKEFLGEMWKS